MAVPSQQAKIMKLRMHQPRIGRNVKEAENSMDDDVSVTEMVNVDLYGMRMEKGKGMMGWMRIVYK